MKHVGSRIMLSMMVCLGWSSACDDEHHDDPVDGPSSGGGWDHYGDGDGLDGVCTPDLYCQPDGNCAADPDCDDASDCPDGKTCDDHPDCSAADDCEHDPDCTDCDPDHPACDDGEKCDDASGASGMNTDTSTGPRVTVEQGELVGAALDAGVQRYLGIPYAKPPLGSLRWQPPQKADAWTRTRAAKSFGERCAQPASSPSSDDATDNEDCLYLNVWTPDATPGKRLPVMFWIHGGGNVTGSASDLVPNEKSHYLYDGQHLAASGVVVVTLDYRLGVLGFFSHRELKKAGYRSGNQGLWDQKFALEWVRKNIAQFGGDPRNVTLFGEASGALDVCAHVASAKSRGLFEQAIGQSGGCTIYQPYVEDAEQRTQEWASQLGCPESGCLDCLRQKPLSKLIAAMPTHGGPFAPVVDRDFLLGQPRQLFDDGDIAKVPYILGTTTDEASSFLDDYATIHSQDAFEGALREAFPVTPDRVLEHYSLKRFADADNPYQAALARIVSDARVICPAYDTAIRTAYAEVGTWMYNFDVPADAAKSGGELVYVFGSSDKLTDEQCAVRDRIMGYWTNLARYGDPNDDKLLSWPMFSESKDARLNFGLDSTIVRDYRSSECLFWGSVYDSQFGITR